MSDLSNLRKRIAAEFSAPARTLGENRARIPDGDPHSLEPDDGFDAAQERYPALKPALAGVGLLGSAAVLGTGIDAGLYLLSAGLAAAGVTGAALLFRDWYRSSARPPAARRRVHEEKASDKRWERSETSQLLSTIHDALGDIAIIRTPDGKIAQANSVFCRLTGWLKPEGMTCQALGIEFEPASRSNHYRVRIASDAGAKIFDWHDVIAREPGGAFMLHSIARDVTEETRIARESEDARRRAENASQAKSRLLATVSHEIRTPLSGILGMSHLISQTRLTSEQKNYLAGMRQSGHALVQLVDDLLDFSSIEAGRFQLRPTPEPLRETIESVVEMLSHRAHEKGIEIGATVAADVPGLMDFDAARLRQVLFNVIGNAVKFTHTGGVLVGAALDHGTVVIRIEDTGPGMNAQEQARVFDEFEQAGGAAQRTGGTGLGLAISRRIMEEHGGSLTVASIPGKGSTFEIRFPALGCDLAAAARARKGVLAGSRVLVMAPVGPASKALAATIRTLGGMCTCAETLEAAQAVSVQSLSTGAPLTDIIVDHRHAAQLRRLLAHLPGLERQQLRKTYLVNPEERNGRAINQMDGYHAWLIRPLREKSLVEVLRGRMKGMEVRDAINDNRPMLREVPALREKPAEGGVLLAEDDPINAFMVRAVLEKAGHSVRVVGDFEAFAGALFDAPLAVRMAPELIITDLNMPGGNGFSMLQRLREHERQSGNRPVPVIVLTSDTQAETREKLISAGASAILAKPADPKALTAEIERLLDH